MKPKKVLIVEDHDFAAVPLQFELEDNGYQVCPIAVSSETAISLAASEKPDLVLMDVGIYGKTNGIEAAKIIQEMHHIPVIFLTGANEEKTIRQMKAVKPFGYLLKPVRLNKLMDMVAAAVSSQD